MAQLYQAAHCFVLPTRGEGFGLPFLEAMATGLPVIATDFGGHQDFCTPETTYLIRNKRLVDADTRCFPHIASQWADPDDEHLVTLMRQVVADYDTATTKARLASEQAHACWTWNAQLSQVF
jgi:glycosyltransferase involved in cell wall biosynthesis